MPGQKYSFAPEVEKIGRELIAADHGHLLSVRVEFVFCEKVPKNKGGEIWGTARVVSGLAAYLAGEKESDDPGQFFVITISRPIWDLLTDHARRALIDHELSHCWVEEDDKGQLKLSLLRHDLEEFIGVVVRRGLWRQEIERFISAAKVVEQSSLFDTSDDLDATDPDELVFQLTGRKVA